MITAGNRLTLWQMRVTNQQRESRSHPAAACCALYNANFKQIVSGDAQSNVHVWKAETGELTFKFAHAHGTAKITAMAFDASMRRLLTGGDDGTVHMWNFNNGQRLKNFNNDMVEPEKSYSLPESPPKPEGEIAAATSKHGVSQASANMSRPDLEKEVTAVHYILEHGGTNDISNRFIVTAGWDRKIKVFVDETDSGDAAEPVRIMPGKEDSQRGHADDVLCIAHCPPHTLASGSYDGTILVWSLGLGRPKFRLDSSMYYEDEVYDKSSKANRARDGAGSRTPTHNTTSANSSNLPGNGNPTVQPPRPISRGGSRGRKNKATPEKSVECMVFLKRQRVLATSGTDGKIRFWNVKNGALAYVLPARHPADPLTSVEHGVSALSSDGTSDNECEEMLFSGCGGGHVKMWRIMLGEEFATREMKRKDGAAGGATGASGRHEPERRESMRQVVNAPPAASAMIKRRLSTRPRPANAGPGPGSPSGSRGSPCSREAGSPRSISKAMSSVAASRGAPVFELGGWRAHEGSVVSIQYVSSHGLSLLPGNDGLLLTASDDGNVSMWTLDGSHVGIFGVSPMWSLTDSNSWQSCSESLPQIAKEEQTTVARMAKPESIETIRQAEEVEKDQQHQERQEQMLYQEIKSRLERRVTRKRGDTLETANLGTADRRDTRGGTKKNLQLKLQGGVELPTLPYAPRSQRGL